MSMSLAKRRTQKLSYGDLCESGLASVPLLELPSMGRVLVHCNICGYLLLS